MLRIKVGWDYDLPEFDPEKHDPDRTFAFLTYRGIHYAKWVCLKLSFQANSNSWKLTS